MRILVDATEPGVILQAIQQRGAPWGITAERSLLHKRPGSGGALRSTHPAYGLGADYLVVDADDVPLVAIERKTLEDLARSVSLANDAQGSAASFGSCAI